MFIFLYIAVDDNDGDMTITATYMWLRFIKEYRVAI